VYAPGPSGEEVEHLHKRHRDSVAVEDVSFTVERGEIFGIIGPNGAGKTTTVETIEGLRTPDRGTVRVLGLDPWRDRAELRERVGVQLQQSDLYDKMRVGEALELFRAVGAAARGESVISPSVATRLLGQVRAPAVEPLTQRELEVPRRRRGPNRAPG
jgi:ABC-type multidrug transport system ATPase subunit